MSGVFILQNIREKHMVSLVLVPERMAFSLSAFKASVQVIERN